MALSQIQPTTMPATTTPTTTQKINNANMMADAGGGQVSLLSIAGPAAAAISNYRGMKKRERGGVKDITPQPLKDLMAESKMRVGTARVSNYNERLNQIQQSESDALDNAAATATSPAQLQAMALRIKRSSDMAKNQLGAEGAERQSRERSVDQGLRLQDANFKRIAQQEYDADIAAYRNAMWQNINRGVNAGGIMIGQTKEDALRLLPVMGG
jgi:hypothetical protein